MSLELLKNNEKGSTYQAVNFKILYRNAGSISGDNEINPHEYLYLLAGAAEITLLESTRKIHAPEYFEFPANTYHRIEAVTDICLVLVTEDN